MAEFREAIPTISGSGTFLIFLIFLALILTSDESRQLAFDWEIAVALVAISIPTSIFITQIYHGYFMKFGIKKKNFGDEYTKYKKDMHTLDVMVDYLSYKCVGNKEWVIIQKRGTAYHLFSMLRAVSFLFLFCYIIFIIWNEYWGNIIPISWSWFGVASIIVIAFLSGIIFHYNCKDVWNDWMILDKMIIRDIKSKLDDWIKEEIDKNRNEN